MDLHNVKSIFAEIVQWKIFLQGTHKIMDEDEQVMKY